MEANRCLTEALGQSGFTQAELAEAVNDYLRSLGRDGTVSDRTVRHWLTGKTRWPHPRQRDALEAVLGRSVGELGFRPPADRRSPARTEDPVHRRNFLTAVTGTTAAVVPLVAARPYAVGTADVIRLRSGLDALTALDASKGGHEALERAALAGASEALGLQKRAASQRIRQRLFGVAANYTASAARSAMDAWESDRAHGHLNRALYLAGMAKDPVAELQVWNLHAMLALHRGEFSQAVHAGQAAQATAVTRRDPLFASLAHARTAIGRSSIGDRQDALRSLGHAEEALAKAGTDESRPSWLAFYGPAELLALASVVRDRTGDSAGAEAASHRALSAIPRHFRRNRALATLQLATAQLHQRDADQACASTAKVFALMRGNALPGRMRSYLGDFHRDLITLAPGSGLVREWEDRYRSEWSQAR
ncbi:XRE family transcriptional regulator [Streptomyces sp. NPDC056347]|uniref:XRE family transcriptional regulator n=1 Tax=Streptomyces sp. NPDC056347 TaxID=3345790 RepID=UPI0035D673BC